jgi:hypothetical protein
MNKSISLGAHKAIVTGTLEDPRARNYFLALGAVLVTVYNLTDLDADPNG